MIRSEFLQSSQWADFQRAQGNEVIALDGMLAYKKRMRFGFKHLYVPRIDANQNHIEIIDRVAKEQNVDFIRFEPIEVATQIEMDKLGYAKVKDFQPSHNWVIDLAKGREQVLDSMHPKTRYNIRLAEKKGIVCRTGGIAEYERFWKLISATYKRKDIATHSEHYYKMLLETNPNAYLSFAEYQGEVIVANLMLRYGDTVTYVHGGSDIFFKHLMAPHLLQWYEIGRAINDGFKYYDFGGIAPDDDPKHPWAGITRFKKGFGGFVWHYPGTYEKGMGWRYKIYKLLAKLR